MLSTQPKSHAKTTAQPFGGVRIKESLFLGDHYAAEVLSSGSRVLAEQYDNPHSQLLCEGACVLLLEARSALPGPQLARTPE